MWTMKFQMFKVVLEKAENQKSNCQHPLNHWKSKRIPEKHLLLHYWLGQSLWRCGSQQTVGNSSRDGNTRSPYLPPGKPECRSRSKLELDMEQCIGSRLGKEYIKVVYCHPAFLTYMQSTSWGMPGWMTHKLESRLPGKISITFDIQKVKRN